MESSSLTRDQTWSPYFGSAESEPLDNQRSSSSLGFVRVLHWLAEKSQAVVLKYWGSSILLKSDENYRPLNKSKKAPISVIHTHIHTKWFSNLLVKHSLKVTDLGALSTIRPTYAPPFLYYRSLGIYWYMDLDFQHWNNNLAGYIIRAHAWQGVDLHFNSSWI